MRIEIVSQVGPPVFRFSDGREPVKLLELRVTEVGESQPAWWLLAGGSFLDEMVAAHILTTEEARAPVVDAFRSLDGNPSFVVDALGVPVGEIRYGEAPTGLHEETPAAKLRPNRLYQVIARGLSTAEAAFYG
jgi:hypothetical protein